MRILALAIVTIVMVSIEPAVAQTYDPAYPVCMHVFTRGFNYYDCTTRRCHSATCRHRDARHSVTPILTMRAQQSRNDATGVTAVPIELIATYVCEGGKMIRTHTALPK